MGDQPGEHQDDSLTSPDMARQLPPPVQVGDGVEVRLPESQGTRDVFVAVTPAAFAPFVRALTTRSADRTYEWIRHEPVHSVWIGCQQKRFTVNVGREVPPDDVLRQLAELDLDELPAPCVVVWDEEQGRWRANPATPD